MADVLYATADSGADVDALARGRRVTPSDCRIADTRRTIERFLENCPDDLTVMELRRELDELVVF